MEKEEEEKTLKIKFSRCDESKQVSIIVSVRFSCNDAE